MAGSHRPGGVTALGIFNLLIGLWSIVSVGITIAMPYAPQGMEWTKKTMIDLIQNDRQMSDAQKVKEVAEIEKEMGKAIAQLQLVADTIKENVIVFYSIVAFGIISTLGLLISSIGLFKMSTFWGRKMGIIAGATWIASVVLTYILFKNLPGSSALNIIISIIYPCILLSMLLFVFAQDFEPSIEDGDDWE